jgi:hypothetical protein
MRDMGVDLPAHGNAKQLAYSHADAARRHLTTTPKAGCRYGDL